MDSISYSHDFIPDKVAKEAVASIVKHTGLPQNFEIIAGAVKTAQAYNKKEKRYIEYNPEFIRRIRDKAKTDWAATSILAHEIGHHLAGHTLKTKNHTPGDELIADEFSGFILYQMGATLEQTIAAIHSFEGSKDKVHPSKKARVESIIIGWKNAASLEIGKELENVPDSLYQKPYEKLVYSCSFAGDNNIYFIDNKERIIWFNHHGNAIVIGNKKESTHGNYAWMYCYEDICYGADTGGNILLETGYGIVSKVGSCEQYLEP